MVVKDYIYVERAATWDRMTFEMVKISCSTRNQKRRLKNIVEKENEMLGVVDMFLSVSSLLIFLVNS